MEDNGLVPICVPVEIQRHQPDPETPRWFRLAIAISPLSIRLRSAVPDELAQGPLSLRLHLPDDGADDPAEAAGPTREPLCLHGIAAEVIVEEGEDSEHAEPRAIELRGVSEAMRARIARYVERRQGA